MTVNPQSNKIKPNVRKLNFVHVSEVTRLVRIKYAGIKHDMNGITFPT